MTGKGIAFKLKPENETKSLASIESPKMEIYLEAPSSNKTRGRRNREVFVMRAQTAPSSNRPAIDPQSRSIARFPAMQQSSKRRMFAKKQVYMLVGGMRFRTSE